MLCPSLFSPNPSLSHQFDVGFVSRATAIRDLSGSVAFIHLFYIYLCTICFMVRMIDYITSNDDMMNKSS
jgi:hypothetical protein